MSPCSMGVYIYTNIVRLAYMCVMNPSQTAGSTQFMACSFNTVHMQESTQLCLNSTGIIKAISMSICWIVMLGCMVLIITDMPCTMICMSLGILSLVASQVNQSVPAAMSCVGLHRVTTTAGILHAIYYIHRMLVTKTHQLKLGASLGLLFTG